MFCRCKKSKDDMLIARGALIIDSLPRRRVTVFAA